MRADNKAEKERELIDVKSLELWGHLALQSSLMSLDGGLRMVPTRDPEQWLTLKQGLRESEMADNPAAKSLDRILEAYARGDAEKFNTEVDKYEKFMEESRPSEMARVRTEAWFNRFAPFYQCSLLYVVVLLLAVGSWI